MLLASDDTADSLCPTEAIDETQQNSQKALAYSFRAARAAGVGLVLVFSSIKLRHYSLVYFSMVYFSLA
jgi:hypothetical protein